MEKRRSNPINSTSWRFIMPSTHNHREQLYLEGAFFRRLNVCVEGGVGGVGPAFEILSPLCIGAFLIRKNKVHGIFLHR